MRVGVLAYIDGSRFTESILLHAAWAARQLDTCVSLVHVLEYAASDPALIEERLGMGFLDDDQRRLAFGLDGARRVTSAEEEERRQALAEAARELRDHGVERVRASVEFGALEDHIREHSGSAPLVIVGKRGELSAQEAGRLGDHIERVIRASRCPVLIAPSEPQEIRRFLIAYDGGPQSGHAIRYLIEQPLLRGCEGTLMLAGDQAGMHQGLQDAASHLRSAGYAVQAEHGRGTPDRIIPDIMNAEDMDLLVMGSFGHSRIHAMLGLSTTRKLLRSSRKAILVVP